MIKKICYQLRLATSRKYVYKLLFDMFIDFFLTCMKLNEKSSFTVFSETVSPVITVGAFANNASVSKLLQKRVNILVLH